ncbi:MAG: hypothetical protein EOM20_07355 [Spartobacteria bacterium]|nr:hypothetical protein [Spartobacteria bacterium]
MSIEHVIIFSIIGKIKRHFSNDWKPVFAVLALLIVAGTPCPAAIESSAPCWTSISHRVFFPVNEPVFLSDDHVLLLQRGNHDYTFFLPGDYAQHPSRNYPLALVAAPLSDEQRQALADLFCAQGWAMLHLELPDSSSPEQALAGLIVAYRDAKKRYPILPNTQLLAGYQTGAEIGAFFAATRRGFAAWIGDDGLFPRDPQHAGAWLTAPLRAHADLLLYTLQRQPQTDALASLRDTLPEGMDLQTTAIAATNPPLPPHQLAAVLDRIRWQLLFERPADGRHYYYALAEYERLRHQLPEADASRRETLQQEMTRLNKRWHFEPEHL